MVDDTAPDAEDAPADPRATLVAWGIVALFVAVGLALRVPHLALGYTSDELGTVSTATWWWAFVDHPETAVNPPLYRMLFNLPFDVWDTPWWGRRFSLVCSVAAIPVAFLLGRRAGRGPAAGLLAAALLAFHPWVVRYGAIHRIYAWWSLTLLLHLWTLARAMDASDRREARRWGGAAVATAVLLPHIHYFSVPVLLVVGTAVLVGMPGRRRWFLAYLPAAVSVLPYLPWILGTSDRRVAPDRHPLSQMILTLGSLDLRPPMLWYDTVGRAWGKVAGAWPSMGEIMVDALLLCMLVGLVGWRRATTAGRLGTVAAVGVFAGAVALAQVQYVRPSAVVMMVTAAAPLLAGLVGLASGRRARVVVALGLAWWWGAQLPGRSVELEQGWSVHAGLPELAATWRDHDEIRGDRPFVIAPSFKTWNAYYHLTHQHPRDATRDAACAGWRPCFTHDGVVWGGLDDPGDGAAVDGLLVWLEPFRPEGLGSSCDVLYDGGGWVLFDCRRGVSAAP